LIGKQNKAAIGIGRSSSVLFADGLVSALRIGRAQLCRYPVPKVRLIISVPANNLAGY